MEWSWLVAPGSIFVVAPLTLLIGVILGGHRYRWRAVLRWWLVFTVACSLVAASKIVHYAWGTQISRWDLTCFSGHSMLAFAFWPLALGLMVPVRFSHLRISAVLAGGLFAAMIAISRVYLGAHPWSEVIAGSLLGGVSFLIAWHGLKRHQLPAYGSLLVFLLGAALLMTETHHADKTRRCTEPLFAWIGAQVTGKEKPPVPCLTGR